MRLLIAEDTLDLNRALQAILEKSGYEVTCTYDGQEALDHVMAETFDGIILDIMMPRMDGIEALRKMRDRGVKTPVLLLTAKAEVDDRVAGLDAGANDYLPKPFAMRELLARVRAMCRQTTTDDAPLSVGGTTLRMGTSELSAENSVCLSSREAELLQLLMRNVGRPLSRTFILGHVWGDDSTATDEGLVLYLSYLRDKLAAVGSALVIAEGADSGVTLDVSRHG